MGQRAKTKDTLVSLAKTYIIRIRDDKITEIQFSSEEQNQRFENPDSNKNPRIYNSAWQLVLLSACLPVLWPLYCQLVLFMLCLSVLPKDSLLDCQQWMELERRPQNFTWNIPGFINPNLKKNHGCNPFAVKICSFILNSREKEGEKDVH